MPGRRRNDAAQPRATDSSLRPATAPVLNMLGIAARAGALQPGTERVREAARSGELRLAIIATDASENSRDKLLPLLAARGISHVIRFDRIELGVAVGRGPLSAVGILDRKLAERLMTLLSASGELTSKDGMSG